MAVAAAVALATPLLFQVTADGSGLTLLGRWRVPDTCAVKRSTGRECPTCHLGRSIVALAHGDVDASRRHHRGGIWLLALVAIQFPLRIALAIARPRGEGWALDLAVTLAVLATVTAAVVSGWA